MTSYGGLSSAGTSRRCLQGLSTTVSNAPTTLPRPISKHTETLNIQPSQKIWKMESDAPPPPMLEAPVREIILQMHTPARTS